ncbi:uncharacterized protein LOC111101251 [Crassostrea virginica]
MLISDYPHDVRTRDNQENALSADRIIHMMLELETIKKTASPQTVAELERRNYQSLYLKTGDRLTVSRKQEEVPSKKGSFNVRKKAFSNEQRSQTDLRRET